MVCPCIISLPGSVCCYVSLCTAISTGGGDHCKFQLIAASAKEAVYLRGHHCLTPRSPNYGTISSTPCLLVEHDGKGYVLSPYPVPWIVTPPHLNVSLLHKTRRVLWTHCAHRVLTSPHVSMDRGPNKLHPSIVAPGRVCFSTRFFFSLGKTMTASARFESLN